MTYHVRTPRPTYSDNTRALLRIAAQERAAYPATSGPAVRAGEDAAAALLGEPMVIGAAMLAGPLTPRRAALTADEADRWARGLRAGATVARFRRARRAVAYAATIGRPAASMLA